MIKSQFFYYIQLIQLLQSLQRQIAVENDLVPAMGGDKFRTATGGHHFRSAHFWKLTVAVDKSVHHHGAAAEQAIGSAAAEEPSTKG